MQPMIDLRSDTVTQPTPAMRAAMADAAVGDDVFGEDPTVNRLQSLSAEKTGKEAGLFLPSGTMGNLIAVLAHCQRGDEAIMGNLAHTFLFEAGGISALGGVFAHTLPNQPDGTLLLEDIKAAVRPDDVHQPVSRLLILENTHNRCGGTVLSAEYTRQAAELAHTLGLKFHLDGARLFNAAAASGCSAAELAGPADSVTFCLSKALSAPAGSVLCGSEEFIGKARRLRKQLGGGMRQIGVLAAAGIIALEQIVDCLPDDHRRARRLAEGIQAIPGMELTFGLPQSNMVFASLTSAVPVDSAEIARRLREVGVLVGLPGARRFRLVLHHWIHDEAVETVLGAFRNVLAGV